MASLSKSTFISAAAHLYRKGAQEGVEEAVDGPHLESPK